VSRTETFLKIKKKLTSSIKFTPKCLSSGLILYRPVLQSTDKSMGFEISIRFKSIIFCKEVNDRGGYCLLTLKKSYNLGGKLSGILY